jgi:hypothetical protein
MASNRGSAAVLSLSSPATTSTAPSSCRLQTWLHPGRRGQATPATSLDWRANSPPIHSPMRLRRPCYPQLGRANYRQGYRFLIIGFSYKLPVTRVCSSSYKS